MSPSQSTFNPTELDYMAEHFFGYGRWDAPFWFVGPEAGMGKDGIDSIAARYESWRLLGCAPLVDCGEHHRGFGFTKWHQPHPPTQPTWRQLTRALLAYKGLPTDTESIREYQRDKWGSSTGETCVIELSGLASPNMQTQRDRTTFLRNRVERIRQEVLTHAPKFIVLYGASQRAEWEKIAGEYGGSDQSSFNLDGLCRIGETVVGLAQHPVALGLRNDYWVALGQRLQQECVH